jgi:hypothetical protein
MGQRKTIQTLCDALLEGANHIEGSCVWPEEHTYYIKKYRALVAEIQGEK